MGQGQKRRGEFKMGRYLGPKHKLARREGVNILDKQSPSLEKRLNVPPGVHGHRGRRGKLSEYGLELREKQKLKRIYGILEKQFKRYYFLALKKKGVTGEALIQLLETRLDNILYRLKLAKTRGMARQLVVHGHARVNNQKVDRPSYQVREEDIISLTQEAMEIPVIKKLLSEKDAEIPPHLKREGPAGKLIRLPDRESIQLPIDEKLIIEYYSR